MGATLMGWLLGTLLGMRHALEPDHLAAVSTLVADVKDRKRSMWLGAFWGVGHWLGLLLLGGSLAAAQAQLSASTANILELAVALMLCALGVRAVWRAREASRGPLILHRHDDKTHHHGILGPHTHASLWPQMKQPLGIGLVHGLAGSGALVVLVAAHQPTLLHQIASITLFGFGSIIGMGALAGVAGTTMARIAHRPSVSAALLLCSGVLSTATGLVWGHTAWIAWMAQL